jgi:D-alanine-D-alanine ligase
MKAVVLHGHILEGAGWDEQDVFVQAAAVSQALSDLGHEPVVVPLSTNIPLMVETLLSVKPAFVFNLVEAIDGKGSLIHFSPAVLDSLGIPYTGSQTAAMFLTSHKLSAKKFLHAMGVSTPDWFSPEDLSAQPFKEGIYIVKSAWEHASIGLDDNSIIHTGNSSHLCREMASVKGRLGGECFAEMFIEGREIGISMLADKKSPQILPPAEIVFEDYPPEKIKVVGYRAKWVEDSFEYQHTPRTFDFPEKDGHLLKLLSDIAKRCWQIFGLKGYARVDFRVDQKGKPWVLEVNANPCLSTEGGYIAAAGQAGLSYIDTIERIVSSALEGIHA